MIYQLMHRKTKLSLLWLLRKKDRSPPLSLACDLVGWAPTRSKRSQTEYLTCELAAAPSIRYPITFSHSHCCPIVTDLAQSIALLVPVQLVPLHYNIITHSTITITLRSKGRSDPFISQRPYIRFIQISIPSSI